MELEWNETDSVGIPSIDDQHRHLVSATNTLFQAIMEERSDDVVQGIVKDLAEYVAYHFAYEEKLLTENGFMPEELSQHIDEHRELTEGVNGFAERIADGEPLLELKLYQFLRAWMAEHMNGTDRKYTTFLQEKGVK